VLWEVDILGVDILGVDVHFGKMPSEGHVTTDMYKYTVLITSHVPCP